MLLSQTLRSISPLNYLSQGPVRRARTFEQLLVHASGLNPAFGQAGYCLKFAPEVLPHAIERFSGDASRSLKLLDAILARQLFVAGDEFSIESLGLRPMDTGSLPMARTLEHPVPMMLIVPALAIRSATAVAMPPTGVSLLG